MRDILNCPNCGAPITGDHCEYCGAVFWDFADIDLEKPSFIKIKKPSGDITMVKAKITNFQTIPLYNETGYYENSAFIFARPDPSYKFRMEFVAVPFDYKYGETEHLNLLSITKQKERK